MSLSNKSTTFEIQAKYKDYIDDLIITFNDLKKNKDTLDFEVIVRMNRLLEVVYYARSLCISTSRVLELMDLSNDYRDNCDANLFRFSAIDCSKNTHYQNFLLFLLDYFYENNYARYNNDIYKMKMTSQNTPTFAWERIDSINNVIYSAPNFVCLL